MIAMIAVSWAMSVAISIPPLFGLKNPVINENIPQNFTAQSFREELLTDTIGGSFDSTVNERGGRNYALRNLQGSVVVDIANGSDVVEQIEILNCVISQNLAYTVFSTVGAFYLPLTFIIAVYLNVYRVARSRIHRRQFNRQRDRPGASNVDADNDTALQPTSVVLRALRSRLSAISLGLPSSNQPPNSASSMPLNRVVSLN